MTKIGEETGNLDVVMKGLAAYYEREENTMQDIKSAISYPLMILCHASCNYARDGCKGCTGI